MKFRSRFLFYLLFAIPLNAQPQPVALWQSVEYAKSINLKGPTIALDKYQNTYMLTNQTDERVLGGFTLVKYDTSGNFLWKQNSQPSFAGIFYGSFLVDSMGSVYVSENYDGALPDYDADAILVKYDSSGTKKWVGNYGLDHSGDSYIYYSEIDTTHGRLITLGMNWHQTLPSENFLFVQALDTSDGSVLWRTEINGVFRPQNMRMQSNHIQLLSTAYRPDSKYFVNTLVDFEGNIIAQYEKPYEGYEVDFNYISKTGDVIFGNRAFGYNVTRVNIEGDTLWAYTHPMNSGTNKNWVRSIVEDTSLNVYATGALEVVGQNVEMTTSKINTDGEVEWQEIFQSANGNFGDGGENVYIQKDVLVASGATQLETSDVVGVIRTYNIENGSVGDEMLISNENIFVINKVFYVKNKIFYVAEGYQSDINNMVAVTGCFSMPKISSMINDTESTTAIKTFPNPTVDLIFISDLDTDVFHEIWVSNVDGKIMANQKIASTQETISMSAFPPGVYTICVQGKNIRVSKKVIKI